MRFFNLDCHISVIADINDILTKLGHTVETWSLSDHSWVFGKNKKSVAHINQDTWRGFDKNIIDAFNKEYGHLLSSFNGFICTYPPIFSMIYEKYEKPIYLQIPIRYEYPFTTNKAKWQHFNDYIIKQHKNGTLKLLANSIYDANYTKAFTGIEPILVRNICQYTGYQGSMLTNEILCHSRVRIPTNIKLTYTQDMGRYQWSEIEKFKAVVFIPYNCSQMSFYEYYSSGIPILCPSLKFLNKLRREHPNQVMSELSWNKVIGHSPGSIIPYNHTYDPNDYINNDAMDHWSQYSDYYDMDGIFYFDDWKDLETVLKDSYYIDRSSYKEGIISQWEELLKT